jgi:ABC-type spermidine/putrescine transport system permease subunit II
MARQRPPANRQAGPAGDVVAHSLFRFIQVVAVIFCLAPPLLIFVLSFFSDLFESFPPRMLTLDMYRQLVDDAQWRNAFLFTIKLAVPTALLTALVVVPAALALERSRVRGKSIIQFLALLPLLMPSTGYAVGMYILYLRLGWTDRYLPLILAQTVISAPVAFIIIRNGLRRVPRSIEFAAMSLGASRARAALDVTLVLVRPAIFAGMLFSVVHVFDDALYVTFLGGPDTTTISKAIFDSIEFLLQPVIAALSAVFTLVTALLTMSALVVREKSRSV